MLFSPSLSSIQQDTSKVVVVGAGLAGLTAAYRLHKAGVDVEVYEARGRVGGRVLTANVAGNIVELGGTNISDGGESEHMLGLVKELGLELEENRVSLLHSYYTGSELVGVKEAIQGKSFVPELLKEKLDNLSKSCVNMQEVLDALLDRGDPLYKSMSVRLAAYEGQVPEKLSSCYVETLYYMLLGGLSFAHQTDVEHEPELVLLGIKGGNALLAQEMAEKLGVRVTLGMALTKLSKNESGKYELAFSGAKTVCADIVVLAIPCSVYSDIEFEGQVISDDRLAAIKSVQYGKNAKLMLPFAWPPKTTRGFLNDRLVSFFTQDLRVLTLYYSGEPSLFSEETLAKTYLEDRAMLELALGESCPEFAAPEHARDEQFASYKGPVGYSWPNDKFVKGSYTYISPGQEALMTATTNACDEEVRALFAPVDDGLYFAGEHASVLFDVPGTMEAACESGDRCAKMIMNTHKKGLRKPSQP